MSILTNLTDSTSLTIYALYDLLKIRKYIKINTEYNSRRPSNIEKVNTNLLIGSKNAKFSIAPTLANPGPIFPRVAIEAVNEVTIS
jgi:hypothetical protein